MEKKKEGVSGKEMTIMDGNAFYEIDMDCVKQKEEAQRRGKRKNTDKGQEE